MNTSRDSLETLARELGAGGPSRREFIRRALALGVSMPTLAALVAACTPTPAPTPTETTPTPTQTGDVEPPGSTAPTEAPGRKGAVDSETLLIALAATPASLDRELAFSSESAESMPNLYEAYLTWASTQSDLDPEVSVPDFEVIEPNLAESWELSEDGRTLTLHLKKGVLSYYGNELTTDDVKWTLDRGASDASVISRFFHGVVGLEMKNAGERNAEVVSAEVIDKYTISETIKEVHSLFVPLQTLLWWVGPYDSTEAKRNATADDPWATEWCASHGIGFGAWGVVEWQPGQQVVYERNENYHRDMPLLRRIIQREVPEGSSRLAALEAGSVDLVESLKFRELNALLEEPGIKVHQVLGNRWLAVIMNMQIPPFDNLQVRQALNYAVPRTAIKENVLFGFAADFTAPVPESYFGYIQLGPWPDDLEKARALLSEAGYPEGFETTLTYNADSPNQEEVAQILRTEFEKLGVRLTLNKLTASTFTEAYIGHNQPMIFGEEAAIHPDANYQLWIYFSKGSSVNVANYDNETAQQGILDYFATNDRTAQIDIVQETQRLIWDDCPWLWGWNVGWQVAARDYVQGFMWTPDPGYLWSGMSFG